MYRYDVDERDILLLGLVLLLTCFAMLLFYHPVHALGTYPPDEVISILQILLTPVQFVYDFLKSVGLTSEAAQILSIPMIWILIAATVITPLTYHQKRRKRRATMVSSEFYRGRW